jgi:hypothetical protein
MSRPGIFQGILLESYSLLGLIQSDPDSETTPGGMLREDLGQLGATQDNETTSEEGVTQEPQATEENVTAVLSAAEETQPTLVQEEPVPTCPEGQVLEEGLCVLEESQVDEQQEEQDQPQQEQVEEGQSSEDGEEN